MVNRISFRLMHFILPHSLVDTCRSYLIEDELEYYSEDIFYFVCDDGFTEEDATVACRENTGTSFANRSSTSLSSINSTNQIFDSAFECVGYEDSLCDCPNTTEVTCASNLVVQIQCEPQGITRVN